MTVTERSSAGVSEEKMTCERGDASGVPGKGITWRPDAAATPGAAISIAIHVASNSPRMGHAPIDLPPIPVGSLAPKMSSYPYRTSAICPVAVFWPFVSLT